MAAVIADSPGRVERANDVVKTLGQLGLPTVRHVASPAATPGLRAAAGAAARSELRAAHSHRRRRERICCARCSMRSSSAPVLDGRRRAAAARVAVREAARAGRHGPLSDARLLMQANARSSVLHADASLQQSGPPGPVPPLVSGLSGARTSRCATTSCSASRSGSDANRPIVELHAFDAQWSEHCSYKSSRHHLKRLPTSGPDVVLGPGEDAGIAASRHARRRTLRHRRRARVAQPSVAESSRSKARRPASAGSFATCCAWAREVIAVADPLRFGRADDPIASARYVARSVVDGIGAYGNAIGVPNLAGDVVFRRAVSTRIVWSTSSPSGSSKSRNIIHSFAPKGAEGWEIVLVGKATDPSGFGGASFSSLTLDAQ